MANERNDDAKLLGSGAIKKCGVVTQSDFTDEHLQVYQPKAHCQRYDREHATTGAERIMYKYKAYFSKGKSLRDEVIQDTKYIKLIIGESNMDDSAKFLKALFFLEFEKLKKEDPDFKMELLLHRAGFTTKEIATLLKKKEGAVAKAIGRAKLKEDKGEQ